MFDRRNQVHALALSLALALAAPLGAAEGPTGAPAADAPAPKTIVLVRHGHYAPDPNADPDLGPGLTPLGVAQAELAGARLASLGAPFDRFFSSPMTRAHETARVIGARLGAQPEIVPDLAECTPPTWRTEVVADEKPEEMAACAAKLDAIFAARFVPAKGKPERELVVAHGNVIRYLTMKALKVDTRAWLEVSVAHASATTILVEADGRFKVIALGDAGHLPQHLQTGSTGMADRALAVPAAAK